MRRAVAGGWLSAVALATAWVLAQPGGGMRVAVPAGAPLQVIVDSVPAGTTVTLGPGEHRGPLHLRGPLTLTGHPGARLVAPAKADAALAVRGDDVDVRDLEVQGGSTGVLIREAGDVHLEKVRVHGARLHGIEVIDGSARITQASVRGLRDPLAQGIEVRNSEAWPDTIVERSEVSGGMEGIVTHVSEVRVEDNVVAGTSLRGIAITEMSDGVVKGNHVSGAGAGLYCGDMSHCEFTDNTVARVTPASAGSSESGWGLVSYYHATASSTGNRLHGAAGPSVELIGGRIVHPSALEPGRGPAALAPTAVATFLAVVLLALAYAAMRPLSAPTSRPVARKWQLILAAGVVAQTFHMIEHVLQVSRVHFDGVPSRGGLAGPGVDSEWVHFAYNAAVLAALVALVVAWRRSLGAPPAAAVRLITAGALIQSYHFVEHAAKVAQHLSTGARVNHGLLGHFFDLVWMHFTINLAVYLAVLAAALVTAARALRGARAGRVLAFSIGNQSA